MFELMERRMEQPEQTPELGPEELGESIIDGKAGMTNALAETRARQAELSGNPPTDPRIRKLAAKERVLKLGLRILERVQKEGVTALDL
jgi:hypothetical protein